MNKLLIIGIVILFAFVIKTMSNYFDSDSYHPVSNTDKLINWSLFIIGLIFIYLS